ncbi:lanthionine synthetase LanC family protein [Acuticoccus sediminis]|uniref:lanthionine synthetase LanC family protein n=1 Tax=Acuticoccus sediminis TaxID=2184697 RepID=UPI001CFC5B23|nr:lanthionine synthetase LanC family protein [Acuticoccus sediminis]
MRQPIEAALAAISVTSDAGFTWFGRPIPLAGGAEVRRMPAAERRAALRTALTRRLYEDFYCCGLPRPYRRARQRTDGASQFALAAAVTATRWEGGWQRLEDRKGCVLVTRGGLTLRAGETEVRPVSQDTLAVAMPTARPTYSPGHHLVVGQAPFDGAGRVWRLYWNVTPEGAPRLAAELACRLDAAGIPYHFKVLAAAAPERRRDGAVLYLPHAAIGGAARAVRAVAETVKGDLVAGVPAMTRQIGPGLAYAESPRGGESFGEHRVRLIADGLLKAVDAGASSPRARLAAVEDRFVMAGISLDLPHRLAGAPDPLAAWTMPLPRRTARAAVAPAAPIPVEPPLATAGRIAAHFGETALWHGERCTWLAPDPASGDFGAGQSAAEFGTLGPNLAAGQAGVGAFLAIYAEASGDRDAGRTARAALHHAAAISTATDAGLYTGLAGVAFALALGGSLLAEPELHEAARDLVAMADDAPRHGFDVMSGASGRVLGLLATAALLREPRLVARAAHEADGLIAAARHRDGAPPGPALSWRSARPVGLTEHPVDDLLGYGHGTSGAAHALLAAYEATGAARFLEVARGALRYERSRFDPRRGGWPDHRSPEGATAAERGEPVACNWASGAVGIGLSRLRAAMVDSPEENRADRAAAAAAIRGELDRQASDGWPDLSYASGLAGALDTLAELADRPDDHALVEATFASALRGHGSAGRWPAPGWSGPLGLMTGLAGVGYFALRRARPAVPSLLALDPGAFAVIGRPDPREPATPPPAAGTIVLSPARPRGPDPGRGSRAPANSTC